MADEGGHADSNQSSGKMGFKDKAGDRHNKKGVERKRVLPNSVMTGKLLFPFDIIASWY